MAQIRLAYSKNGKPAMQQPPKKSDPSSVVLVSLQFLLWKIERLQEKRPAAVEVLENLVDDMLSELEGRRP